MALLPVTSRAAAACAITFTGLICIFYNRKLAGRTGYATPNNIFTCHEKVSLACDYLILITRGYLFKICKVVKKNLSTWNQISSG